MRVYTPAMTQGFWKTADKSIWAKSIDPTVAIGKAYRSNLYQNGQNAGRRVSSEGLCRHPED